MWDKVCQASFHRRNTPAKEFIKKKTTTPNDVHWPIENCNQRYGIEKYAVLCSAPLFPTTDYALIAI